MASVKKLLALLVLIAAVFVGPAQAGTSTIDPNVPQPNSPVSSSVIRNNFSAAYNDVNALYALIAQATGLPGGANGSLQYNNNGAFGGLTTSTLASYAAHNILANGITIDPRDPKYGAICHYFDIFTSNGTNTNFTYTIPFTGVSSTDNSGFMVWYEAADGTGTATILGSTDFTVTGVNSGVGGTIILNNAAPSGYKIFVAHDDSMAIVAASTDAVTQAGSLVVPPNCTIYGSPMLGTKVPSNAQWLGQGFSPNYDGFSDLSMGPILTVIAPTGLAPPYGLNISGNVKNFFSGFQITSKVVGVSNSIGFYQVPVLIGANTGSGAGGGGLPGITAQYMTFSYGKVGFGSPIGGASAYIFSTLRFNNFSANTAGVYGPLSDFQIIGNNFNSNGAFGTYGSAGGLVIGPQQAAPGAASAGRIEYNRFEYNSEGIVTQSAALINMEGNQFDGQSFCGLDLQGFWNNINITGGWFRGNANGGGNLSGSTTAGRDAHICFNGGSGAGSTGLHLSNVSFYTNYSEGNQQPLGTPGATTPPYVFDFNTAGSDNEDVSITGGDAKFESGNNGASVTDFAIFRNGRPSKLKINIAGQAVQGSIANGSNSSQARGLPANSWTALKIIGDASSNNNQFKPLSGGWGGQVARQAALAPTYYTSNNFSSFDCDIVNLDLVPNLNPTEQSNAAVGWLPSPSDPTYGGGSSPSHLADTNTCRLGGLTWAGISIDNRVYGQNFTNTGTWGATSPWGKSVVAQSSTNGDTSVGTINTNGGPIYLWFVMRGNNGGTFTWQLDSGPVSANIPTQGNNAFTFPITTSSQTLGAIRIPVKDAGSHTVKVTVTSATSASNTVDVVGVGTPTSYVLHGKQPTVFLGGQVNNRGSAFPTAIDSYNTNQMTQATQLAADGLAVAFVPVRQYLSSVDYNSDGGLNTTGQGHVAKAFLGVMQAATNVGGEVNPMDFGASCASNMFMWSYCTTCYAVNTTASSPTITINNYNFQPGVATQYGGGDVGKKICFGYQGGTTGALTCTYIASVNQSLNQATLGQNAPTSQQRQAVMGGYPTNPADPSTAADDTLYVQAAAAVAGINGGKVHMPTSCMIRDLRLPHEITVEGNAPGDFYEINVHDVGVNPQATTVNCAITGAPEDNVQVCIHEVSHTLLTHLYFEAPIFPYTPYGLTGVYFGHSVGDVNEGPNDQFLLRENSFQFCPVCVGAAYGYNQPVNFTGSISNNGDGTSTMTVTTIDSYNFYNADKWTADSGTPDFLAYGRAVTGAGVTAGTNIISVAPGGGTGTYILNKGMSVSSEALTSAGVNASMSLRTFHNQYLDPGMAYNGGWTDSDVVDDTCTGTFMNSCAHIGPFGGSGNGGNRWTGGRIEESDNGQGAIICDGCQLSITGLDWDFNGTYNLHLVGSVPAVQITGGDMYAGGQCAFNGTNGDGRNTMIRVGGTDPTVSVDGTFLSATNFGSSCGNTQLATLFSVDPGTTPYYIGVNGGNNKLAGSNTKNITQVFDWTNGVPRYYRQNIPGFRAYDSSISGTGAGVTVGNLTGLTLANDIATPTTKFSVAAGTATSADGTVAINLPFSIIKQTTSWGVGSNSGCLDTGSIAANSWYNIFIISQATVTGNATDILCSLSQNPQLPATYTHYRRIGSLETNGSSQWVGFTQYGNRFVWNAATLDVNDNTLGTTAKTYQLNVPPGVNVNPICRYTISNDGNSVLLTGPSVTDVAPTTTNPFTAAPGFSALDTTIVAGTVNSECPRMTTDTTQHIRARATAASTTLAVVTTGWEENFNTPPPAATTKFLNFMNRILPPELTFTRSTVGWFFSSTGVLTSAAVNTARFDTGSPGSVTLQGLLLEPATANSVFFNRDFTQSQWVKDGNETIVKNQTGIDNVASSASSITATAANATVCQAASSPSLCWDGSVYLKRLTGTGNINVSIDGGSTYTTESISSSFARYVVPTQTLSNPSLCVQVVTNGDAIAVDAAQLETTRDATGNCFPTSPILSTTATGGVKEVVITNAGSGGTTGTYPISFTLGSSGCSAPAGTYTVAGGVITTTTMTTTSSGCTTPPVVAFNRGGITGATGQAIIGTIRAADIAVMQAWPWYNINQGAYMTQWVQGNLGPAVLGFTNMNLAGTLSYQIGINNGTIQAGGANAGTANIGSANLSGCTYTTALFNCASNNTLFSSSAAKPGNYQGAVNLNSTAPYWLQAWYYWSTALTGAQLQAQTAR